ncbi:beta-N-acetylhexosaminidase [Streptomyces sp. P38-E01]|uniref:beta-N-acetylhexosaminidase n=1 Tax=Streptomyces tardus TaxID=2780544 RepID=A0A949JFW8_9ACTN|nr:beta-N-acetylhexosaminidase [Streptomyces tardus]MBU7598707.1 beta-N-acetylhexosaminidase [Streptomyces tardus]
MDSSSLSGASETPLSPSPLIPAPVAVRPAEGALRLDADTALAAAAGTEGVARWLRTTLGAATGWPLLPDGPGPVVRLELDSQLAAEAHRLTVDESGVRLVGGSAAGVFWAAQTLRQLLGPVAHRRAPLPGAQTDPLPHGSIEDEPRFGWRGFMLDVSRHFMPKDGVLRYIDLLAAHKLNVLHLHLTDDQGWRVEIKRYPRLTEVGGWRPGTRVGHRASGLWDERRHGGCYTQDDIREIVAYAAERHITVVPEIEVPGHSQAAIAAYPELGNTDAVDTGALDVWTDWGISANVLAPTDEVLHFYENVLTEILELFPGEFVHLGGDECPKEQWQASQTAKQRIVDLDLADEEELQTWFIRHFDRWLAERGRRLIGWDEILSGGGLATDGRGLGPGAAVTSWRGYAGGVAAARSGRDVVICPEQHVYLDHRQAAGEDEPVPIGFVRTLRDVYEFEPLPPELAGTDAEGRVLGAQANLWTEVAESRQRVDYQAFPRLAAFAEVVWSGREHRSWPDFEGRMVRGHYARLDAMGIDYRPPGGPRPWQQRPGVLGRPIDGVPPIV